MKPLHKLAICFLVWGMRPIPATASLTEIGSVTATNGEGGYGSAIIDSANNFVHFGSSNPVIVGFSPISYISQVETSPTFTYFGTAGNFSGFNNLTSAIFDSGTGYSYWTSSATPSG